MPFELLQLFPPDDRFWPWFFGGGILWGIIGMLMGWWHVKLSSGCPLAT